MFVNYPGAEPSEYSDEFDLLGEKLALDGEELLTLTEGSLHKVKLPQGKDYSYAVTKAITHARRFRDTFKGNRFVMINIFYYLSELHGHELFNIPAKRVATSAHTKPMVVYAFINMLVRKGYLEERVKEDKGNHKGRLFKWLDFPVSVEPVASPEHIQQKTL